MKIGPERERKRKKLNQCKNTGEKKTVWMSKVGVGVSGMRWKFETQSEEEKKNRKSKRKLKRFKRTKLRGKKKR